MPKSQVKLPKCWGFHKNGEESSCVDCNISGACEQIKVERIQSQAWELFEDANANASDMGSLTASVILEVANTEHVLRMDLSENPSPKPDCYGHCMVSGICKGHHSCSVAYDDCFGVTMETLGECNCKYKRGCMLGRQAIQVKIREGYPNHTEVDCWFYKAKERLRGKSL